MANEFGCPLFDTAGFEGWADRHTEKQIEIKV